MKRLTSFIKSLPLTHFIRNERAVSFNVGYTITIAITTVLLIGIISGVGGLLHAEQDKAVNHQVTVTSDNIASGVMATDRVANTDSTTTNITVTQQTPSQTVAPQYFIELRNDSTGPSVHVETSTGQHQNTVPITTETQINETRVTGGGTIYIAHTVNTDTGERELVLHTGEA